MSFVIPGTAGFIMSRLYCVCFFVTFSRVIVTKALCVHFILEIRAHHPAVLAIETKHDYSDILLQNNNKKIHKKPNFGLRQQNFQVNVPWSLGFSLFFLSRSSRLLSLIKTKRKLLEQGQGKRPSNKNQLGINSAVVLCT